MWGYFPPAVSEVFLPSVVARLALGDASTLEDAICGFLGSRAAAAGSSWVKTLAALLAELAAQRPDRAEVVLPSYSCNEFSKAALLAGLTPRFVDLRADLASDPAAIEAAIGPATLAVFAINNIGRESDNAAIRALCDARSVTCIEDATYTFLGRSDRDGRRFGTYGHVAVLNFSEGKIIPVGGGAVIANDDASARIVDAARARIGAARARSTARELISLLVYRAGSSHVGYTAYRLLREATGADLKKRMSMEPTRAAEVDHDLQRKAGGGVEFRAGRAEAIATGTPLAPLGRAKQICGAEVIKHEASVRAARERRYAALRSALRGVSAVEVLPFPAAGTCIKAPIVMRVAISAEQQRALDKLGVCRGYLNEYPTYGLAAYPNSNRFFDRLFTLPLHRDIDDDAVAAIVRALRALGDAEVPARAARAAQA